MNSQFKKGVIDLCILNLISNKSMSSFEVLEHISHALDVNENTVYPILRRLTRDNILTVSKGESSIGAPRKYYSLTDIGVAHLDTLKKDWNEFVERVSTIMGGMLNE